MARAVKCVKLDDREVMVMGLLLRDITDLIPLWGELAESFTPSKAIELSQTLLQRCTNLTWKEMGDLSFADLDKLEAVFREVNEPFLRRFSQGVSLAKTLGIERLLVAVKNWFIEKAEARLKLDLGSLKEAIPSEKVEINLKEVIPPGQKDESLEQIVKENIPT